jgi:hypothetical protein
MRRTKEQKGSHICPNGSPQLSVRAVSWALGSRRRRTRLILRSDAQHLVSKDGPDRILVAPIERPSRRIRRSRARRNIYACSGSRLAGRVWPGAGLAAQALAEGGDRNELGRIGLARFFAEKLATAAPGLARAIASGGAPLDAYEAILAESA